MDDGASFADITRALVADGAYRETLSKALAARTIDDRLLCQLITYARSRETTMGQALTRKMLTDAGVSWEAL
ncbi:MAG: hypothetical protein JWL71_5112 [Acidobacteria bacterium]|nr:hypothetical protein [Acidobacteriota bacterium]